MSIRITMTDRNTSERRTVPAPALGTFSRAYENADYKGSKSQSTGRFANDTEAANAERIKATIYGHTAVGAAIMAKENRKQQRRRAA